MVFWFAILGGALFVWLAVRRGFFETWGLSFNSIISIYMAIFLAPSVARYASATGTASAYSMVLSLIVLAGGCFAILYGLSYVFLIGQFRVSFPETVDILLAGPLGFLTGFLVLSFVSLVITAAPLPQHKWIKSIGFTPEAQSPSIACVAWCCDLVHSVVGAEAGEDPTREAIRRLFVNGQETESPYQAPATPTTDVNDFQTRHLDQRGQVTATHGTG